MTNTTLLYAQRRARLAAQLGAGGIAIIPTAPERQRNRDSDYLYRHDSYFYFLTGFTEPHASLVITADGECTLFCQAKDLEREIAAGRQEMGEAIQALCFMAGANSIFYGDKLLTTGNPDWQRDQALLGKLGITTI